MKPNASPNAPALKLYLADVHLHRARLLDDRTALAAARKLIDEIGYERAAAANSTTRNAGSTLGGRWCCRIRERAGAGAGRRAYRNCRRRMNLRPGASTGHPGVPATARRAGARSSAAADR
ncbi:hypothetical protein [Plasticicumulans sp.]|uniref:hypothetical protein n=1 Tax=Plasticicumulans sp. TaxID=2307179 RepID=UPI0039225DD9